MRRFSCRILVENAFLFPFSCPRFPTLLLKKTSYGKFFIGNRSCKRINRRKTLGERDGFPQWTNQIYPH